MSSFAFEESIFIEHVVEVRDPPFSNRFLVIYWEKVEEIEPSEVCFETDNILHCLGVFTTEQNARVVLVANKQLHWRFHKTSDAHEVGSMLVYPQNVQEVTLIILGSISLPWSSKHVMIVGNSVLAKRAIGCSIHIESLMNFSLKNSDAWLIDGEVCHINIETMELNSPDAFLDIVGKFWLTDGLKAFIVRDCRCLVELSEQNVEINHGARVYHEFVPVSVSAHWFAALLELADDLLEVPGEGENVSMFVFVEGDIGSHHFLMFSDGSFLWLAIFLSDYSCIGEVSSHHRHHSWVMETSCDSRKHVGLI